MELRLFLLVVGLLVGAVHSASPKVNPFKCTNTVCDIHDYVWPTSSVMILVTPDYKVWRSNDEGMSFNQITNAVDSLYMSPANPSVVYFVGSFGKGFGYSTDAGATIEQITLPAIREQIVSVQPHPTQDNWILMTGCVKSQCSLYVSKDYGTKWETYFTNSLLDGVVLWGNSTADEPDLLYVWKSDWSFGYTTNYGGDYTVLFRDSLGFVMTSHYLFVGVLEYQDSKETEVNLYSSSGRVDPTHKSKSSFILADFPFGEVIPTEQYNFLDDVTRAEYIGIKWANNAAWGTVYNSEHDGLYYQLSLDHVFALDSYYIFDFHRFNGLGGIYVANQVPNYQQDKSVAQKQTFATYDNGGSWNRLRAPPADMSGKPFICNGVCYLNMHAITSWYTADVPGWHTRSSAIGLMIGNGNVGDVLSNDGLTTFLSRDAGLSWAQIYQTTAIYEFGDHGGILVIAPYGNPVNYLDYSFDQGLHFERFNFTDASTPMFITGIYNEPNATGFKFVVKGETSSSASQYIYSIDFGPTLPVLCTDIDYETFTPSNGYGSTCFMGATYTYQRRKQSSQCYNDRSQDPLLSVKPCACTFDDYECLPFYNTSKRNATGAFSCTKDGEAPPCVPGLTYFDETGYALIPDTSCAGGLQLEGQQRQCGGAGSHAALVAGILIPLFVIIACVSLVVLYKKNDRFRSWFLRCRTRSPEYSSLTKETDDNSLY